MGKMLQSYSIKNEKKGTYRIKFKVDKGVKVTFNAVGDVNQVHLKYDSEEKDERFKKNYVITGSQFNLQFFQHESLGKDHDEDTEPEPKIIIKE